MGTPLLVPVPKKVMVKDKNKFLAVSKIRVAENSFRVNPGYFLQPRQKKVVPEYQWV